MGSEVKESAFMYVMNQLTINDERSVIGHYKSLKLTDPDAIYSERQTLLKIHRMYKIFGWLMFPFGLIPTLIFLINLFFFGSFSIALFMVTLLLGGGSLYMILKERKASKFINSATEKYCLELGVSL